MKLTEEQMCHIENILFGGENMHTQTARIMAYLGVPNISDAGYQIEAVCTTPCKSGYWKTTRILRALNSL